MTLKNPQNGIGKYYCSYPNLLVAAELCALVAASKPQRRNMMLKGTNLQLKIINSKNWI